jgi:perosamine synthetase
MKFMDHDRLGFNYRLTDIQAAIGVAQLERLDHLLGRRTAVAAAYSERLAALGAAEPGDGDPDDIVLPAAARGRARRSWFVYVLRLPRDVDRDAAIDALERGGIDARPYLPCIHLSDLYRERLGTRPGQFPVAEEFSRRSIALPFHPAVDEETIDRVVGELAAFLGRRPA